VQAPFATPPTERDRKRLWIGLGVGAALLLLCCGGGVFGIGTLVVSRTNALRSEAVSVVQQYLTDLRTANFAGAYRLLCSPLQGTMTQAEYTSRERARPRVTDFTVGPTSFSGSEVLVMASVQTEDGVARHPTFALIAEGDPPALRICAGG
jgi:hypothetical protein